MNPRSARPLPVVSGQDESIASALMGLHLDPMQSTSGTGNNIYIASGDARQIAGSTFTGPVERVEVYFTGSAEEDKCRQNWLRILRWLAPVNQSKVHNTAKRDRQPKATGTWFIDGPELNQWLVNPASLIWLHGSVGCGKTVLCSSIIEKIRDVCKDNKASGLCYFYCSFKDSSREDHLETLLRLFIYQLCRPNIVSTPLQSLYNECHEYPPSEPTNEELYTTLTDILEESHSESSETSDSTEEKSVRDHLKDQGLRNIYLIIDALDEIPPLQRWEVLEFLQKLANLRLPQLHMLVTSRNEPSIETALTCPTKWRAVLIDKSAVESDMRLYVSSVLTSHPPLRRQPDSVKDSILLRLVDQGNGMFRWAALQVAMLKRLKVVNPGIIRQVLNKLPKDLDETYIRILTEIDRELYNQAINALKWLVCSIRPMFVEELAEACSIHPDKSPVLGDESERLEPYNVIEMLYDLVSVEPPIAQDAVILERTHSVVLAHFSVQEFLAGSDIGNSPAAAFRVDIGEAHYFVARCCLAYLYYYNAYSCRVQSFPLRGYAWYNWEKHILPDALASNDPVRRKAVRLYNTLAKSDSHPLWETHLAERSRESHEMRRVIDWLPPNGEQRLLDALNIPYFHADFDRFMKDHLPTKATRQRDSWGWNYKSNYEYSPLSIARKEVRLLTMLPSLDEETEIRCQLRHVSLDDYPSYEALSYTWGHFSENRPSVFLEGVEIPVTPNLASLLRRYRSHQENRLPVLWVDAISMNQQDVEERSCQVQLMGRIFEQAQEVVVGLGEEEEHDELAIKRLTALASISLNVPDLDRQRGTEARFRDMVRTIVGKGEWSYILRLFKREWWRRCWVIQEIVLAAKATLLFGTLPLDFSIVEQVMRSESIIDQVLRENVHPAALIVARRDPGWQAALHIAETRRERRSGIQVTLPKLLYRFSGLRSADPRDKIYSLLGLVSHEVEVIPNYNLSFMEVYTGVAINILYTYQNLDILSFCSKCSATFEGLPTWVPCFSTPSQIAVIAPGVFAGRNNTRLFTAGGVGTAPIIESASESLMLGGWVFDQVARMGEKHPSTLGETETQPLAMVDAYAFTKHDSSLMTAQCATLHLPSGQSLTEAYWRTLLADQWREGERLGREAHGQSAIPPTTAQEAKTLLQEPDLGIYLRFLPGRRFFLTSYGYLALGPEDTRPGDVIAVMPGGAVPYVLRADAQRSQNTEHGVYRFIGECYVHGIMDGEVPAERARESREPQYQVFKLI